MARPTNYDPAVHPKKAKEYAERMYTDLEIAAALGIGERTYYRWKAKHRQFRQAISEGKEKPNREVEASLKHLCLPHKLRRVVAVPAPTDAEPNRTKIIRVEEQEVDPNPRSVEFFLKNRRRDKWAERIGLSIDREPMEDWKDDADSEKAIMEYINGRSGKPGSRPSAD
jgi:transposase-like protein